MERNDSPAAEERQPQDDEGRVDIGASLDRAAASMAQSLESLRREADERDPERDELVAVDAVREALECGDPITPEVERAMLAALDEVEALRAEVERLHKDERDEVERLREQHTKFRALYNKNVGSLVDQLDEAIAQERTGWTVHLTNGSLTGYPSWQRAVFVGRQFARHQVVRISGPEGTVPLVGESLTTALAGGAL